MLPQRMRAQMATGGQVARPDKKKIPLNVGWLSENSMLREVIALLFPGVTSMLYEQDGMVVSGNGMEPLKLEWSFHLEVTLSQLLELGFDPGDEARIMLTLLK